MIWQGEPVGRALRVALLSATTVLKTSIASSSRFARDLVAQELGLLMLIKRGMRVLTAAGDDAAAS
jgi:hypothetical protein